jgi:membrane protein DedA with SNARE-associated domain
MNESGEANWILALINNASYPGIALLMFAETVFPPIPSEVVMPIVGFLAADGRVSLAGGIASGTAGSLAGAYAWFFAARRLGATRLKQWAGRHGRWLTISPDDVDAVSRWFERYGTLAVLLGRLVPAVRSLISVPAGIANMPTAQFLIWSAIGASLWSGFLAGIGFALGERYEEVVPYIGIVSNVVIGGALLLYVYRLVTFSRRQTGAH